MLLFKFISNFVKSRKELWFYFTKKSKKRCWAFIPTDVEKEKDFFLKKLQNNPKREAIISEHVWSLEFRVWMINNQHYDLLSDVNTDEEVEALFNSRTPITKMVKVLKNHTPSKKVVDNLDYKIHYNQLVFFAIPEAFRCVSCEKIVGISDIMWQLILIAEQSKDYATLYKYLHYITTVQNLSSHLVPELLKRLVNYGREVARLVPVLEAFYPDAYVWVRENIEKFSDNQDIIQRAFIANNLPQDVDVTDINDVNITGRLDAQADALAWLKVMYNKLDGKSDTVFDILLSSLDDIKRVNGKIYSQICHQMCQERSATRLSFVDKVDPVFKMEAILRYRNYEYVQRYSPFTNWPSDIQKKAIKIMIDREELSLATINAMPEDLKKSALGYMDIRAQIAAVTFGSLKDIEVLCQTKRADEVERHIAMATRLCNNFSEKDRAKLAQVVKKYMLENEISFEAFSEFVRGSSSDDIREYIETKQLSKKEYAVLLASKYKYMAVNCKVKE